MKSVTLLFFLTAACSMLAQKTVLLTILARNKAHTLPLYLECVDNLLYDKKSITVYINTNDNHDQTESILKAWAKKNEHAYEDIFFDAHVSGQDNSVYPHEWSPKRFSVLATIRNRSLEICKEKNLDYYFVVDCDNFIIPETLQDLIVEDKPIVAPLLLAVPEKNDYYANFFADVDGYGYYKDHRNYYDILLRKKRGTFEVPVVHCTYLVKKEYLDLLSYKDETQDYEFVIFSRLARKNNVSQYICNKKNYGFLVHFFTSISYQEEVKRYYEVEERIRKSLLF